VVWDGIMLYKCWRVGTLFCVVLLCVLYVVYSCAVFVDCVSFLCISCVTILVVRLDGRKDISYVLIDAGYAELSL